MAATPLLGALGSGRAPATSGAGGRRRCSVSLACEEEDRPKGKGKGKGKEPTAPAIRSTPQMAQVQEPTAPLIRAAVPQTAPSAPTVATSASKNRSGAMLVCMPDFTIASRLASEASGIGQKAGVELVPWHLLHMFFTWVMSRWP